MSLKTKQLGVGLIEVMISLLVIAVGVLGYLGLQTVALKQNQEAYYYGQSNMLANDLFERMRLNLEPALNGGYNTELDFGGQTGATRANVTNCATSACSGTQLAAWDLDSWQTRAATVLPPGKLVLSAESSGMVNLKVTFDSGRGEVEEESGSGEVEEESGSEEAEEESGSEEAEEESGSEEAEGTISFTFQTRL